MAQAPAASVSAPRPRRRLSLRPLHPAGRIVAHPGARPAGDGAHLLRGGDPREPRSRPPQPSEPGVRPQGEPPRAGAVRTRVITDGVVPSLHVDYKKTRIK